MEKETKKRDIVKILLTIGVIIAAILFFYNDLLMMGIVKAGMFDFSFPSSTKISYEDVTPKGIPAVYGRELGIKFDDISASNPQKADATITILGNLDRTITLSGEDLERYKNIGLQISCEYCCGAESIIFKDGSAACGCAHSFAMRGIAKYLIKNHETEFTDDEILEEMGKWKVLFFPGVHAQKAAALKENGIEINYINLASNKYRGIEKGQASGAGGEMVGGC